MASNEALKKVIDEAVSELDMEEARYLIERVCSEALEAAGFKPETVYMEVPRCDRCRFWVPLIGMEYFGLGQCSRGQHVGAMFEASVSRPFITFASFGCVQFEARQDPS